MVEAQRNSEANEKFFILEGSGARAFGLKLQSYLGATTVSTLWWNANTKSFVDLERDPQRLAINLKQEHCRIVRAADGTAIVMVLSDNLTEAQKARLDTKDVAQAAETISQQYPELNEVPVSPRDFHNLSGALSLVRFHSHELQDTQEIQRGDLSLLLRAIEDVDKLLNGSGNPDRRDNLDQSLRERIEELSKWALFDTNFDIEDELLPGWISKELYDVIFEAFLNAGKHSLVRTFSVTLRRTAAAVRLEISDDGDGGVAYRPGGGLETVRRHVLDAGGSITIDSQRGDGTHIVVELPCA